MNYLHRVNEQMKMEKLEIVGENDYGIHVRSLTAAYGLEHSLVEQQGWKRSPEEAIQVARKEQEGIYTRTVNNISLIVELENKL